MRLHLRRVVGFFWLGPVAVSSGIAWHPTRKNVPQGELALVIFAGVFDFLADLVLIRIGGLAYAGSTETAMLGTNWIVALWMASATSVNVSLAWIRGWVALGTIIGIIGGLVAYTGGRRLGVVAFDLLDPRGILCLGFVWGVGIPLLIHAAQWCEGLSRIRLRKTHRPSRPASVNPTGFASVTVSPGGPAAWPG